MGCDDGKHMAQVEWYIIKVRISVLQTDHHTGGFTPTKRDYLHSHPLKL